jgi:predicted MFS family arabinose efflux permease
VGALGERDFRLFLAGQTLSQVGDGVIPVVLPFAVLAATGSTTDLGLVLAARSVAIVALTLGGGVIADRVPRKRVLIATDVTRCLSQAAFAALILGGGDALWAMVVLQAVHGVASAASEPASTGILPALVPTAHLQQANGLRSLAASATRIGGPVLGGVIVAVAGAGWGLALDAASFAASAACLAGLAVPGAVTRADTTLLDDLRDGWRAFVARSWIWTITLASALGNLLFTAYFVLGPVVALRSLGGAASWGIISAAFGAGAVLGGVVALRRTFGRPLLAGSLAMVVFPAPLALLAVAAPVAAIAAAAALSGAAVTLFSVLWETALAEHVPRDRLSRVAAYDAFGSLAGRPLGAALVGPVAAAAGTGTTLWLCAGGVLATTLAPLLVPGVRTLRHAAAQPAPASAPSASR